MICDIIKSGINFWTVNNKNMREYLIPVKTLTNHEWKGGTPNLKIKASLIKTSTHITLLERRKLRINTRDASLWEIKYFTPVRMACSLNPLTNIGIKQSMFISKQTHCLNNLLDLIDKNTHVNMTAKYPANGLINKISSTGPLRLLKLKFYSSIHLITQLKKVWRLTLSTTIGINLWLAPQISEHWPKYSPGRWIINLSWFNRPGTASAFTPKDGTVHEWSTSAEDTRTRTWVCVGRTVRLSTSSNRNIPSSSSPLGTIYLSNSSLSPLFKVQKSLYSYLQYHWCPIVFNVKTLSTVSSNIYKRSKDGSAICNNNTAGIKVQTHSTICISTSPWLMCLPKHIYTIITPTKVITNTKIKLIKSWSWVNSSIKGEFESWKLSPPQVPTKLILEVL